jgi:hypothetical protein
MMEKAAQNSRLPVIPSVARNLLCAEGEADSSLRFGMTGEGMFILHWWAEGPCTAKMAVLQRARRPTKHGASRPCRAGDPCTLPRMTGQRSFDSGFRRNNRERPGTRHRTKPECL